MLYFKYKNLILISSGCIGASERDKRIKYILTRNRYNKEYRRMYSLYTIDTVQNKDIFFFFYFKIFRLMSMFFYFINIVF